MKELIFDFEKVFNGNSVKENLNPVRKWFSDKMKYKFTEKEIKIKWNITITLNDFSLFINCFLKNKLIFLWKISLIWTNNNANLRLSNIVFSEDFIFLKDFSEEANKIKIKITHCVFKKNLLFANIKNIEKLQILRTNIKWTLLLQNINSLRKLEINWNWETKIWKISFEDFDANSWDDTQYLISWIQTDELIFENSSNLSNKFVLQDLDIWYCKFINSDLWKTIFNSVNLRNFYLKNSVLNNCIFNWVDFPEKLEEMEDSKEKTWKISDKKMKDNYRQLKFVMDKNWNYTEANNFFEKEMEYEMFRIWIKKWFWRNIAYFLHLVKNLFDWKEAQNFWKKIHLLIWLIISDFWNNYMRVLFWIFLLSFLSTYFNIWYNWFDTFTENLENYTKLFFYFLYPLYWISENDFIKHLDGWLTIWFIFYKVIYAILFWHLIVALKRTTKR